MLKIKAYHFNPINLACIALLVAILAFVATPAHEADKNAAMKDYQIQISNNGEQCILWDNTRVVAVLPLDNKCNFTEAICKDNQ